MDDAVAGDRISMNIQFSGQDGGELVIKLSRIHSLKLG